MGISYTEIIEMPQHIATSLLDSLEEANRPADEPQKYQIRRKPKDQ